MGDTSFPQTGNDVLGAYREALSDSSPMHGGSEPVTDLAELKVGDESAGAYLRMPEGARAGVVVLHAWWGLNDDVIAYSDRLVDAGFAVIAPDMFRGQVATEPDDAERLSNEGDNGIAGDVAWAAIDRLAADLPDVPIAVLGWSFGAAYAIWAPSVRERVAATVAYYGTYVDDFIGDANAPLIGHFAEEDPFTSEDDIRVLEEAYRKAGRDIVTHRYTGTGHWFAEPSRDAYRPEAANLAFDRTVAFLRDRLGGG
jgi:carboxymethylenebutenolidase